MKSAININAYSAGLNTSAFANYLENGGDPNLKLKAFWRAYFICMFLVNKSIFLYPLALLLGLLILHPVPLFIVYPLVYFHRPPQPLIYYAILAHNVNAIKLLVKHGVDLSQKNISSNSLSELLTPLESLSDVCSLCCYSKEIVDLLTPYNVLTMIPANGGSENV